MKRTLALGGAVAGMLATAAISAPAHADSVPAVNLANTNFAAKQVVQYWIGEAKANLVNATPYAVETEINARGVKSTSPVSASDKPGTVGSSGDKKAATAKTKNINLPRTLGKVFFTGADGKPHWCSATSVQGYYKNLVATAGHCVYDTKSNKETLDNWIFVPGYYQGKTPWGLYVGKTAYTHSDYSVYEDGDRDYAFVTVYNGVQVTGASSTKVKKWIDNNVFETLAEAEKA
ncbi:trypsin-like serine peptidase, partial [Sphaerimonospora thailandensis]|uniref:trypsin-like serine peptidase n=1 Tax=Sphaerimonospora thailandensis TaxID=795644 RepID=UPI003899ADDB